MFDIYDQNRISSCGDEYFITKLKPIVPLNCTFSKKKKE